jgi:hypothetical protein
MVFCKELLIDFSLSKYSNRTAITLSGSLDFDKIEVDIVYFSKQTLFMKNRCDRDENLLQI